MKKQLVTRLAEEILADENWGLVDPLEEWNTTPLFEGAMEKIRRMRPATLGRLAACGKSYHDFQRQGAISLYEVHQCTWIGKYDDGKECLQRLAATAVAAECLTLLKRQKEQHTLRKRKQRAA